MRIRDHLSGQTTELAHNLLITDYTPPDLPADFDPELWFNRYHQQKVVLQDAATELTPVIGAFQLSNLNQMVKNLGDNFGVTVVRSDAERIVVKKR